MLEETTTVGQRLLTTKDTTEAFSVVASCAQPTSNKMRAYQQHLSRLAADAQVDLSRVTQEHAQETSRTARDLMNEVKRTAAEQTDNQFRQQREDVEKAGQSFQFGAAQDRDNTAGAVPEAQDKTNGNKASMHVDAKVGASSLHGSADSQSLNTAQPHSGKRPS